MNHPQHESRCGPSRFGITLVELIVVLGALAVVTALILPAIQQSREAARRSTCKNNLKQFGMGLHNYHEASDSFPFGCVGNPSLPPEKRWSWYTFLGCYWGQIGTPSFDLDREWDVG
jgi:type II secretory pathway pseudopilin PulG